MGTPLSLRKIGGLAAGAVLLLAACGDDGGSDDEDAAGQATSGQTDSEEAAAPADDGGGDDDDGKAGQPSLRRDEPAMRMIATDAPAVDAGSGEGDEGDGEGAAPAVESGGESGAGMPDPVELPEPSGDDALDALAQECHDGDMEACDDLYRDSPIGSELEAYADSCAGRQDLNTGRWCVNVFGDGADASGEPVEGEETATPPPAPDTEADLDTLSSDCEGGDMVACDTLFNAAEAGSEDQIYGDTCAGRQPVGTGQWCVDTFGEQTDEPADQLSDTAPESTIFGEDFDPENFDRDALLEELGIEPFDVDAFLADLDSELGELGDELGIELGVDGIGEVPDEPVDVEAAEADEVPTSGDATLDDLAQSCHDGDMEACDSLFMESEFGSEMETYGDTCAGRQPEHTGRWCVDVFA